MHISIHVAHSAVFMFKFTKSWFILACWTFPSFSVPPQCDTTAQFTTFMHSCDVGSIVIVTRKMSNCRACNQNFGRYIKSMSVLYKLAFWKHPRRKNGMKKVSSTRPWERLPSRIFSLLITHLLKVITKSSQLELFVPSSHLSLSDLFLKTVFRNDISGIFFFSPFFFFFAHFLSKFFHKSRLACLPHLLEFETKSIDGRTRYMKIIRFLFFFPV